VTWVAARASPAAGPNLIIRRPAGESTRRRTGSGSLARTVDRNGDAARGMVRT
jgi:hypothetical protein